jgi:3-hydroxyisobutyrate dehydrogenase
MAERQDGRRCNRDRKILLIAARRGSPPIAKRLRSSGADVILYHPTTKAGSLSRLADGRYVAGPASLLSDRDVVIIWLRDESAVNAVCTDSFLGALRPDTLVIDHTMGTAEGARALALRVSRVGASFVDAPILWGAEKAGGLLVMVGADDDETLKRTREALDPYVSEAVAVGPVGAGRVCRMANQLMIAGALGGLAEGLGLVMAAGLDPTAAILVLAKGGAQSRQLRLRSMRMIDGNFRPIFTATQMRSDIALALDEARRLALRTPVSAALRQQYDSLFEQHRGHEDCCNLFRLTGARRPRPRQE